MILDDLLGSDAFTKKTKSVLVNAMIKNRHMGICFAVLVQSIKAVPKNIRLNCSVFQLASFKNKKVILEDIYDEVSNVIGLDEFEELYDFATDKPYGSLIIDTTNGKRFLSNLDSVCVCFIATRKLIVGQTPRLCNLPSCFSKIKMLCNSRKYGR